MKNENEQKYIIIKDFIFMISTLVLLVGLLNYLADFIIRPYRNESKIKRMEEQAERLRERLYDHKHY